MEKEFEFSKEMMTEFAKLIDERKINLLGIGDMGKEELQEVGETIGLEKVKDKSLEMLRKEIGQMGKILIAGQVMDIEYYMFIILFLIGSLPQLYSQTWPDRRVSRPVLSAYHQSGIQDAF